jgi:hypothetical protein
VYSWDGSPFFHLLSHIEEQLYRAESIADFDMIELILQAVIESVGRPLAKPHMLLGDLCREKNRKVASFNRELLLEALTHYKRALEIQPDFVGCTDKIAAVDRHIELIDLLTEGKYRSIPSLILLIGTSLTTEYYKGIREFLLTIVQQLIKDNDFPHAISLLTAMSYHDKSTEIRDLIEHLLNIVPSAYVAALKDAQEHILSIESGQNVLETVMAERNEIIERLRMEADYVLKKLLETKFELEEIRLDRDKIKDTLQRNLGQLQHITGSQEELNEKIRFADRSGGRGVLVNFGVEWACYIPLRGIPTVQRGSLVLPATEGLMLIDDDDVHHKGESIKFLPPDYKSHVLRQHQK